MLKYIGEINKSKRFLVKYRHLTALFFINQPNYLIYIKKKFKAVR